MPRGRIARFFQHVNFVCLMLAFTIKDVRIPLKGSEIRNRVGVNETPFSQGLTHGSPRLLSSAL